MKPGIDFVSTMAERDAWYKMRMLSKRTIYTAPNERLIIALTTEDRAAVRVSGSFSASWIWNTVRIALPHKLVSRL
jgi:hypothetical protein